jgi:hypothetical protein
MAKREESNFYDEDSLETIAIKKRNAMNAININHRKSKLLKEEEKGKMFEYSNFLQKKKVDQKLLIEHYKVFC